MDAEPLLIGHQQHQPDGGAADLGAAAEGQLGHGLVDQQQERVVGQPGDEIAAKKKTDVMTGAAGGGGASLRSTCLSPAGGARLDPQLDAEQTHGGVLAHLDLLVVGGAED